MKTNDYLIKNITSQFHPKGRTFPINAIFHAKIAYSKEVRANLEKFTFPKELQDTQGTIIVLSSNIDLNRQKIDEHANSQHWIVGQFFTGSYKKQNYYWGRRSLCLASEQSSFESFCQDLSLKLDKIPLLIKTFDNVYYFEFFN